MSALWGTPKGSATHHKCAAGFAHTIERGALEASIGLSHHHHINCSCHMGGYLEQSAARRQGIDLQVQQNSACSTSLFAVSSMQVKLNARAGTEYTNQPGRCHVHGSPVPSTAADPWCGSTFMAFAARLVIASCPARDMASTPSGRPPR